MCTVEDYNAVIGNYNHFLVFFYLANGSLFLVRDPGLKRLIPFLHHKNYRTCIV